MQMTPCEVLCWIGYGRAIKKEDYFAPLRHIANALDHGTSALLHRSIPDPKPAQCPMDDAERVLIDALRSGEIVARFEKNGILEVVPRELLLDYALVVSARGVIEIHESAEEQDKDQGDNLRHDAKLKFVDVFFRTKEVLERLTPWPHNEAKLGGSEASDRMTIPPTVLSQHSKPAAAVAVVSATISAESKVTAWLVELMRSMPEAPIGKPAVIIKALAEGLPKIPGRAFDRAWLKAVRESGADAWSAPGRRKTS